MGKGKGKGGSNGKGKGKGTCNGKLSCELRFSSLHVNPIKSARCKRTTLCPRQAFRLLSFWTA
jgi:hypothetical protein